MGDPRISDRNRRRLIHGLVMVVLLAAMGGGLVWWTQGNEEARHRPVVAAPKMPPKLCDTAISTRSIIRFRGEPQNSVRMHEGGDGGLDDHLDPYAIYGGEQTLMCFLNIDGEAIIVDVSFAKSPLSQAAVDRRVKNQGASGIEWDRARGYVYSVGASEQGAVYFPCTIRRGTSGEVHRAVSVGVTTAVLRQEKLREREAVMNFLADVMRYAAKHSAKCLNVGELSGSAPVLK